jgi:hypothetical protein
MADTKQPKNPFDDKEEIPRKDDTRAMQMIKGAVASFSSKLIAHGPMLECPNIPRYRIGGMADFRMFAPERCANPENKITCAIPSSEWFVRVWYCESDDLWVGGRAVCFCGKPKLYKTYGELVQAIGECLRQFDSCFIATK